MNRPQFPLLLPALFLVLSCSPGEDASREGGEVPMSSSEREATVEESVFGQLPDGEEVKLFTLTNANGLEVRAITYGGIILSLKVPDRNGTLGDIALGYDDLAGYLAETPYFGAIIGRYGNRIGAARFELDGVTYGLAANNGENHLHGGIQGFDKVNWEAQPFHNADGVGIVFSRTSPDGEEGYPGNLQVQVTYTLTDNDLLIFDYLATTDRATPVNLTQHTYFNLAGDGVRDVLGHRMAFNAERFTPVDEGLIPTGELAPVEGTPFDFRELREVGNGVDADHEQIRFGGGYDHNFVLGQGPAAQGRFVDERGWPSWAQEPPPQADGLTPAVEVVEPSTGRIMKVWTSEPGIQFYSGNFLDGSITGKGGMVYLHRFGFCLETQHFPDSPNQEAFPSTILRPGEEYRSRTVYAFSTGSPE